MTEPKDRIAFILNSLGLNARQLATTIDVNPQVLYDIKAGKTANISPKLADAVSRNYPDFNKGWIISGEGEPILSSRTSEKNVQENGIFVPAELVQMFGDMAATIRSQQETIKMLTSTTEKIEQKNAAGL